MIINNVKLDKVAVRESQYPENNLNEFLLVGRSNVGKSSFINALINQKNLAHTSATPGRTRTLNFYLVNNSFYLVDVPGYGYAKASNEQIKKFGMMIEEYIEKRENLRRVYMLLDFKIKPTEDDLLMYKFLKYYEIPVTIIATKVDKIGVTKREKQTRIIKEALNLVLGDNLILFSSKTKYGKDKVLSEIENIIGEKN